MSKEYSPQQLTSAYEALHDGLCKEGLIALTVLGRFQGACSKYVGDTAKAVATGSEPDDEQYRQLYQAYQTAKSCLVNSGADISMLFTDDRDFVEDLARAVVKLCFEKRGR